MRFIHKVLGALILFLDWVTSPKGIKREKESQDNVDIQTKALTLYQYKACPFCVKVRRSMKRQSLNINTLDAKRCETARQELLSGGGKLKVPCLKIAYSCGQEKWMYDSKEIIRYLEDRFQEAA